MEQMENLLNYSRKICKKNWTHMNIMALYDIILPLYMIFGKTPGKYETLMDYSGKIYGISVQNGEDGKLPSSRMNISQCIKGSLINLKNYATY